MDELACSFAALEAMGDGESTDAKTRAQDAIVLFPENPVVVFAYQAAFFVLENLDRLRWVTASAAEVWPRTDDLFAAFEAHKRAKRGPLANLAEAVEAEVVEGSSPGH